MPIYYKVVSVIDGKFYSFVVDLASYRIEYKLGEIITDTKLNGIFVFETLDFAKKFIDEYWPKEHSILSIDSLNNQSILPDRYESWSLKSGNKCLNTIQFTPHFAWPEGTLCFKSIKVLKEEYQHTIIWDTPTQEE